ncbi:hypothetical protein tloyanaT_22040 [Thalassotalea loyana]|uniref:Uncharacterized protein n=1 Tax=Thalassotalea loyana TaxID=280483 RepID=A0ABQ6HGV6_9GAMM|nr:hypothetical protein tloyanaT_22040 [Thalassotalea loyana]
MISVLSIFLITLVPAITTIAISFIISWYEDDDVPLPTPR